MKKVLKNNRGFTLIELIVVLVVLTILMCLTAPSVFGYSRKAQETAAIEECKGVVSAVIDILSDKYVNTGIRITGDKCLVKTENTNCYDHPIIEEARTMAGVDGKVNGLWVRGNPDYILSHLVYEWSNNLWVVYDEGEYKVYRGMTDAEKDANNLPKVGEPMPERPTGSSSNGDTDEDDWDDESESKSTSKATTEKTTETTTETTTKKTTTTTEKTTETTTETTTEKVDEGGNGIIIEDSEGGKHFIGDTNNLWEKVKENSNDASYDVVYVEPFIVYADSSGVYVSLGNIHVNKLDMSWTFKDYLDDFHSKYPNDTWTYYKITEDTKVFIEADKSPKERITVRTGDLRYFPGDANHEKGYYIWTGSNYDVDPGSNDWRWNDFGSWRGILLNL